jgi:1-pyrroline-5-carboxylate dehydrogenase
MHIRPLSTGGFSMTNSKNPTYVDLMPDERMHTLYERGLERVITELGLSHPIMIGGNKVFSDKEFETLSPLDRQILIGKFSVATPDLIRSAIATAHTGFPAWRDRDWKERSSCIRKTVGILDAERFLLAALVTFESGKNRYEALAEVGESIDMLRYHAEIYEKNEGFVVHTPPESPGAESRSILRPYGVWAVISPFNFPLSLATGMAGAALITGNGIILKPTSIAPFSVLKLYHAFIDAGVPADAVQYVTGPGSEFGRIITAHPDIDGIAFTGSRDAGMLLHRTFAAQQRCIRPFIAEMGSKNPVIVTGHADLDKAVEGVSRSAFGFSGQKCSAASRVYVHESVAEQFIAGLCVKAEGLAIGDPRLKDTFMGPLIDDTAQATFREAVDQAKKDGGRILSGGAVLTGGNYSHGYYVQPTIVSGLPPGHPLATRELFVPFLIIDTFSSLTEALEKANASEYGLTAGIFSEVGEEVTRFFAAIQSGVTYANRRGGATTGAWPGIQSFGGWKASGSTGKGVGGPYYLQSYMREQAQTWIH